LTDFDGFIIRPFAIELAKDEARSRQQISNHSSGDELGRPWKTQAIRAKIPV
jgi:hypothetical protein